MNSYENNLFYQKYKANKKSYDFVYGEDYLDCISHDRYLVLIPFNLKVMRMLQPYMRQTHNCLVTSNEIHCLKDYFISPYCTWGGDIIKVYVFDLARFRLDDLTCTKEEIKQIAEINQEAFFTFWLDRQTTEPLYQGYCYGGQYFNIVQRHKESNYKERKKGIAEHREFFYNIKENLIDKVKTNAIELTKELTKELILGKLKTHVKFCYAWSYEESEFLVITKCTYLANKEGYKIIRLFETWEE